MTSTIWFHDETNYRRFKEICTDGNEFPASYAAWLELATKRTAAAELASGSIQKIKADPDDFLLWCRTNRLAPNKLARLRYANARVSNPAHSIA